MTSSTDRERRINELAKRVKERTKEFKLALQFIRSLFLMRYPPTPANVETIDSWINGMEGTFCFSERNIGLLDNGTWEMISCYLKLLKVLLEEYRISLDEVCYAIHVYTTKVRSSQTIVDSSQQ